MFLLMLEKLMNEHNLNKNKLAKLSGIPYTTINNFWTRGYENVAISTVKKLAAFFNVSLDYLVLGTTTNSCFSSSEQQLIEAYRSHPEMQAVVNKILDLDKSSDSD